MRALKIRMNRSTYWLCVATVAALYMLVSRYSHKQVGVSEVVLLFLCVPRLHDIGLSGWWSGGVIIAEITIAIVSFILLPLETELIPIGVFVLLVAAAMIWLGFKKGDPASNRFGAPPAPGLSFARRQSRPS